MRMKHIIAMAIVHNINTCMAISSFILIFSTTSVCIDIAWLYLRKKLIFDVLASSKIVIWKKGLLPYFPYKCSERHCFFRVCRMNERNGCYWSFCMKELTLTTSISFIFRHLCKARLFICNFNFYALWYTPIRGKATLWLLHPWLRSFLSQHPRG